MDNNDILLLNAYVDGELSPAEALAMERRLAEEPALRRTAAQLTGLSAALVPVLVGEPAPERLRAKIVESVGFSDMAPRPGILKSWPRLAAAALIGFFLGAASVGGALHLNAGPDPESVERAVLSGHLRSLIAPQPFDIASSDRHVVKPWFNGRTTIAPVAPDFAAAGFPLAGGRIDIVGSKAVPSLVYRRDRHVISVTIVPREAGIDAGMDHRDGSTIIRWTSGDLTYWVISDLNGAELGKFVEMFKSAVAVEG